MVGGLGVTAAGMLGACTTAGGARPTGNPTVPTAPALGRPAVETTIRAGLGEIDLGGISASTWTYDGRIPGGEIRARAGDVLRVHVDNALPSETSIHWHGIRLHNAADGVPGFTQEPIAAGSRYTYEFTVPDPGTYFFHPHTGVQIDRGLYAPLIVDDPAEPGGYDHEWVLVLDDWTDGIGRSPDDILEEFMAQNGTVGEGMNHDMHGMGGMGNSPLGDVGDIAYPHFLINGRIPAQPLTLTAKPGQRARLRLINASADTLYRVALGAHEMTVTHTDGFPVEPAPTRSLYLAQGERADVLVTLGDGVFPFVAAAEGKTGQGMILIRTGSGAAPSATVRPSELDADPLITTDLTPTEGARLPEQKPDQLEKVTLNGQMQPYAWGMNGAMFGSDEPILSSPGARVRMQMTNMTMMAHPMHIHGHTWSLPGKGGLRKDTVLVLPMQTLTADLQADNPGIWAFHCHNIYHAELGMMTSLRY
ncbi:MAG TPA: multicopper oxidase family protein [Propionibacteriaceae bacterium]|nr:multicopper oxidase family protein [Propionibacteriaceae bacterium]